LCKGVFCDEEDRYYYQFRLEGPLIDEMALLMALEKKQIAGAGLDVYEAWKPLNKTDHPLKKAL